ncbi:alpha-D-ribose 1-methylphosphonate 5-triphosphate diphosphatase [Sinorhizobium medicae]|nr:alpha-D-ribose 1-methylphosphonate 5-triphosphate diphosphatase [Sinorhizobium medicae]
MWLSNFALVLKNEVISAGSLLVEDGLIADIRREPVANAAIDGGGRYLMPGFVDLHGDMIEREIAPRPNANMPIDFAIFELDKKMATAGVTTAFAAISFATEGVFGNVRSLETTSAVVSGLNEMRDRLLIDHRVHARYEITNTGAASRLQSFFASNAIHMISLTDHTPGQGQYSDLEAYVASISERRSISLAAAHEIAAKKRAARDNPEIAATLVQIIDAARLRKLPIASHDDDSAEKIAEMHRLGVTISEFPVSASAAAEATRRGLWTLMGSPNALRGKSMTGNLSALAAAESGNLNLIAADYHPAAFVPAIFRLAEVCKGGLPEAVAMATANPATSVGLGDRGEIAIGRRADLLVVETGRVHRIRSTLCAGRMVYNDGTLVLDHEQRIVRAPPAVECCVPRLRQP